MGFVTLILVYVVIWWLVFFAALPVGVKHQQEPAEGTAVDGHDSGAPSNPNLKKKALYTSAIAFVLTTIYYFVAASDLISFRA